MRQGIAIIKAEYNENYEHKEQIYYDFSTCIRDYGSKQLYSFSTSILLMKAYGLSTSHSALCRLLMVNTNSR